MVKAYIDSLRTDRTKRTRLALLVAIIAVVIFAAVFWTMRFIGITMTDEAGCGMLEHTHTEECYERVLICKTPEGEEHTHTDECYEMVLICGKEEHTHTALCYPDTSADVESPEDWEATLPASDNMTGDWAKDLVAVAQSQVGYRESERNYNLNEDGSHSGYTRFGAWYGSPYIDWNATFIAFCLNYAKIPAGVIPYNSGVEAMMTACDASKIISSVEGYSPAAGDIAFIDSDGDGKADSVAVISSVLFDDADSASALTTTTGTASGKNKNTSASTPAPVILVAVEGDIDGEVKENIYTYSESGVLGFLNMEELREKYIENTPEPTEEPDETDEPAATDAPESTEVPEPTEEPEPIFIQRGVVDADTSTDTVIANIVWDDDDNSYGSISVTVRLLRGTTEVQTAVLNSSNNWTYAFTGLTAANNYHLEYGVPHGYSEQIDVQSGRTATWTPFTASTFTVGNVYAIVRRTGSSGSYTYKAVGATGTFSDFLENYPVIAGSNGYPLFIPDNAQWQVSACNSSYLRADAFSVGASSSEYGITRYFYLWEDGMSSTGYSFGTHTAVHDDYYSLYYASSGDYGGTISSYRKVGTSSTATQFFMKDDLDKYGEEEDLVGVTSSSSASKYGVFVRAWASSSTTKTSSFTIYLHKQEVVDPAAPLLSHKKQIDWLGDGDANSDAGIASPTEDDYRLYLDVQGRQEPVDILFVVDLSSSMEDSDMAPGAGETFSTSVLTDNTGIILRIGTSYALAAPTSGTTVIKQALNETSQYQRWYVTEDGTYTNCFRLWNPATEKYLGYDYSSSGSGFGLTSYGYSSLFRINDSGYLVMWYNANSSDSEYSTRGYVNYSSSSSSITLGSSGSASYTVSVKAISRIRAMNNFLNGVNNSGNGFVNTLLTANPYNKIAIVTFGSDENASESLMYKVDSSVLLDWSRPTTTSQTTINPNKVDGGAGTNYCAGLYRLDDMLSSSLIANDGRRKLVIFLSDGSPTYALASKSATERLGNGQASNADNAIIVSDPTYETIREVVNAAKAAHSNIQFNSIAFHNPATDSHFLQDYLQSIASRGNGAFYEATNTEELENAILSATMPRGVVIADTLSEYVDYNTDNPALKVTMTKNGVTTVLWQNGSATTAGSSIIESCAFENGQVKLELKDDYLLQSDEVFTVSFNVKINQYAKDQYTANQGYGGMTGDYNTDYGTNATSSFKPGFYSNTSAEVSYEIAGGYYLEEYSKPVVQTEQSDTPTPAQDATFEHDKVIDWLGDGDPNPDTQLTGDNMYRLYLDWTGEFSKPYDLMLVIDRSASMLYAPDGSKASTSNPSRETLVERVLNGYGSDAGLIATFLDANPQNRISIVTFGGEPEERMDITSWSSATGFTDRGVYTLTDDGYYLAASTSGTSITYISSLTDYAKWVAYESSTTSGYFVLKNVATGSYLDYNTSSPYRLYANSESGCRVRLYNNRLYVYTGESSQYYVDYNSSYGYVISTSYTTFTGKKANLASYSYEIDSAAPRDWGRNYNAFYLNVQDNTGTNYEAGLLKAQEKWASSTNPNKLMIFLSDGEPTYWVKSNGDRGGTGGTTYSNLHGTSENGSIYESKLAWDVFHSACPTVTTRALLFGSAMNQEASFSTGFAYTFRNTSGTNLTIANNSTWYYYVDSSGYPYLRTGNGSGSYLYYNGSSFGTGSSSSATYFRLNPDTGYLQYYVSSSSTWANTSYGSSYIKAFRPLDMSALNYIDDTGVAATIESDNTGAYQALLNTLSSFIYPSDVEITDTLSKYVRFDQSYGGDLKVTRVNKTTGVIEDLYIWPNVTTAGNGIIESVTYTEGDTSNEPTDSTGTITVKFVDGFTVDPNYKYTLSFNVNTTKTAENEKADNEAANRPSYSVPNPDYDANDPESPEFIQYVGDLGTDYSYSTTNTNTSSSTMPGFRSNQEATVSMTLGGTEITENYDHPVVQVNSTSGGNETVENFEKAKTIDWLGDGDENPDTDLTGEEYYRLYLNWSGEFSVPYDLLIVVDTSGSMLDGVNGTPNPSSGNSREEIVESVLNGSNGIIQSFLNANEENTVAVVKFGGEPEERMNISDWATVTSLGNGTYKIKLGDNYIGADRSGSLTSYPANTTSEYAYWTIADSDYTGWYTMTNVKTGKSLDYSATSPYPLSLSSQYAAPVRLSNDKLQVAVSASGSSVTGYRYAAYSTSYGYYIVSSESNGLSASASKANYDYTYMVDSSLIRAWGRNTSDVELNVVSNTGTNYAAGLRMARNVLNNSPHQNKIMIFLSDGVPTYWLVSDNERGGTGKEITANVNSARTNTIAYAEAFKALFPNVPMYGILFNSQSGVNTQALAAISTSGQAYTATSGTQLVNYFNMATSPSNMKIVDYLSQYVEFDEHLGGDIVVTCVNKTTGDFEVLYDDGAITDAGTGIIKPGYPIYTAWEHMTADEKAAHLSAKCTGKIELQFENGFVIDPNLEYTLSFNVHVTQTAKDEKTTNVAYYEGYVKGDPTVTVNGTTYHLFNEDGTRNTEAYELLDETTNPTKAQFDAICNLYCPEGTTDDSNYIGDPGTDYAYNANGIVNNNSTSSLMPGFRSNDQATVSYTFGTEHSEEYDHPVVQVTVENEEEEDTSFHNSKVIDWLGDYDNNPDTDVDDAGGASADTLKNLYRLYLDMSGKQNKGCDLMIIVDQSNSMNEEISTGYTRIDAVNDVLWGKVVSGLRSGGLVKDFLDANDGKNRICILGFGGAYTNQSNNVIPYPYANDTTTFRMWGRDATPIEISAPTNWGTNYCAALRLAQDAWDQVYAENTNKLMIFLSDGEPSFYMRYTSDGLRRFGNGTSTYIGSTTDGYTMSFYDTFRTGYPKVHTESVGFGSTFNTTVLNYFAKNGDPSSSAVALRATDYESLLAALKAQIYPSSIVISDALSKYVRYYSPDADMKVTMKREIGKDATTGDPIYEEATIFENGAIVASAPVYVNGADTGRTVNGADYLRRVSYTEGDNRPAPEESTGTVEVEFNPEFVADPSYTFTVSFNVIATQTAYNAEQNGVAHNIGDEDTDYPGNNTSSGKLGYFSNDSASRVTYNIGSATQEDPYDKPVIQGPTVEPPELGSSGATATATKTWDDENDKYQLRPEYVTVRLYADGQPTGKTAQLSADNNWTFTWTDLPAYAEDGVTLIHYSIEEDYVYGYTPTYADPTFTTTGERVFKLIYYPNEGTGTAVEETYNESTSFTTTAKAPAALGFSRTGYNFTGWNTKPDGSGTSYAVGATVSLANGGIALYAQWEQDSSVNTYTITFSRNGATSGYLAPVTVTTAAGQTSVSYTLPDPTGTYVYEGHTFAGWAMGSASGSVYQAGAAVTISADTTFYATWTQTVSDLDRAMNVSGGTLHFESTDAYPWTTGTSGEHFYGTSGNAGQNSTSSNVTTTVTLTEASTLTFEYYYSSESGYDKCYFYIDGTVQSDLNGLSGSSSGWIVATYTLSAGTHTLKWTFTKDSSSASGNDQFWVDNVAITAGSSSSVTWTQVTSFDSGSNYTLGNGKYYRFVHGNYAMSNSSGTTVTRATNNENDPAQWWLCTRTTLTISSNTYNVFTLKNVKTGNYLYYASGGSGSSTYDYLTTNASNADTWVFYATDSSTGNLNNLYENSSGARAYFYVTYNTTNSQYRGSATQSNGLEFTLYQSNETFSTSGSVLPTPNESVGELPDDVWNRITVDTTDANFFLLNGKTVVLTNGQGLALANDAGTTVNYKAVNENDPAQQWVVSADVNSATFALRNVKTGYYLNYVTTRGEIFFTADAQNTAHSKLHSVSPNTFRLGKFDASDDTLALCSEILTVYQHKTAFNPDPDSAGDGSGKVGGDDDQHIDFSDIIPEETEPPVDEHIEHSDIVPVTSQQPAVSDSNSASAPTKAGQGNGTKANSTYTLVSAIDSGSRYLITTEYNGNTYVLTSTLAQTGYGPKASTVTVNSDTITGDYTAYEFLAAGSSTSYTFYNESIQKYLGITTGDYLGFVTSGTTWSYSSNKLYTSASSSYPYIYLNTSGLYFNNNTSSYSATIKLYKLNSSTPATPCTITYMANGNQYGNSVTANSGSSIALPATAPAVSGWTFSGWVEDQISNEITTAPTFYDPGASYNVTGDATLYALYTREEAGGSTETVYQLLTATPDSWAGRYVITSGTDTSLYVLKGISGNTSYESTSAGGTVTYANSGMTLDGSYLRNVSNDYIFTAASRGTGVFSLQNVSTSTYVGSYNDSLYSRSSYSARYCNWALEYDDTNGCMKVSNSASSSYPYLVKGSSTYFVINNVYTTNKTQFWKETQISSSTIYYTTAPSGSAPSTVTVTFNPNGGTLTGASSATYTVGAQYNTNTAFTSAPTLTGYTFDGWYDAQNGGNKVEGTDTVNVTGMLYAHWTINTYTVTFKDHDGTILKTQTVNYGGSATPPANPTRTGYTFTGWSGSYTNVTANTEVTAQYQINVYTLTINYVDTNGQTVAASYTHTYDYNAQYYVTSPTVSGYTTTQTVVSGNMPAHDETITVVYTANGQTPEATETTAPTPTAVPTAVPTVSPVPTTAPTAQPTATPAPTESPAAEYIYVRTDHFENGKEYVICIGNYALGNTIYTSGGKQYTKAFGVTANNDQVAVSSATGVANVLWTVSGNDTNGWILQNIGNGTYLGFNSAQYMIPTIQADSIPWFYSAGTFRNNSDSDGYYYVSLASDNSSFTTSKKENTDVRIYVKTPVESTTEFTVNWFMGVTNKLDRKPLQVDKHVAGVNGPALYGAQFTLVRADESFEPYVDTDQQYLAFNAISDVYGQVIFYDVMPGSDGNAYGVNCLPYGNYVLTEVSAPDGHEIVGSGVWHVIVDENGARVVDENGWPIANDSSNKPAIVNMPTYELAETGGMGVYGFTAVGGMLMLVPAVYAIVDRRRRKRSSN